MDGSAATAEQAAPVTEGHRPDWRAWVAIGGVTLGLFMGALENTVAGTAMPTIVASLGGIEHYSWVFAAYMLAATVMIPLWGKMADLVGRRPALFGGLAFFMLGSALCGAAHSMPQLIAFRVVQGLGAGALFPVGMIIAADLFTLRQRTKVIAMFSAMWGVASLVGPLAGGYLTGANLLALGFLHQSSLRFDGSASGLADLSRAHPAPRYHHTGLCRDGDAFLGSHAPVAGGSTSCCSGIADDGCREYRSLGIADRLRVL